MADRPFGFRPIQTLNDGTYNGKHLRVAFAAADAAAAYIGDMLEYTGDSADDGETPIVKVIDSGTAETQLAGALIRLAQDPDGYTLYRPASTFRYAYIAADRNIEYIVQEDADTTPLDTTAVGDNIGIILGAGSTITGQSIQEIDSDSVAPTATLPLRIIRKQSLVNQEGVPDSNPVWVVRLNTDHYNNTTGV